MLWSDQIYLCAPVATDLISLGAGRSEEGGSGNPALEPPQGAPSSHFMLNFHPAGWLAQWQDGEGQGGGAGGQQGACTGPHTLIPRFKLSLLFKTFPEKYKKSL